MQVLVPGVVRTVRTGWTPSAGSGTVSLMPDHETDPKPLSPIQAVVIEGVKSHRGRTRLGLAPLTLLAGSNSSGKSTVMQALLALKQTTDSNVDRGGLRVDGPHVQIEGFSDWLWRGYRGRAAQRFSIGVELDEITVNNEYVPGDSDSIELATSTFRPRSPKCTLVFPGTSVGAVESLVGQFFAPTETAMRQFAADVEARHPHQASTLRASGLLLPVGPNSGHDLPEDPASPHFTGEGAYAQGWLHLDVWARRFREVMAHIIHLPGYRGDPRRRYDYLVRPARTEPEPFSNSFASVLTAWMGSGPTDQRMAVLSDAVRRMGLGWKVDARREGPRHVEVKVARTEAPRRGGAHDLVRITEVGFGVSQVMPVLVALIHAMPNQLVYIEQPEIHLHPRAQRVLAELTVEAVQRGVRVVAETHSEVFLLAVQMAVASGRLDPALVNCHWFTRDPKSGESSVSTVVPDRQGRLGDWPVDFADVSMDLQRDYLRAAMKAKSSELGAGDS